jgi:hypothetical protein
METSNEPAKQKRRRHFSLRLLPAFVATIGVIFGWFAWKIERSHRLQSAIRRVEQLGGVCVRHFADADVPPIDADAGIRATYRRWLWDLTNLDPYRPVFRIDLNSSLVGQDLHLLSEFSDLTYLTFAGPKTDNQQLKAIPALPALEYLYIEDSGVTDGGLAHLRRFGGLTHLSFAGAKITGTGLVILSHMPKLSSLCLNNAEITDEGLQKIPPLPNLRKLYLNNTRITDAVMPIIAARFPRLQSLWLYGTAVTDAGLIELSNMNEFVEINLPQATSDAGLKYVAGLSKLENLILEGNSLRITNAGLAELTRLERLHWLILGNTAVTADGFKQLRGLRRFTNLTFWLPDDAPDIDVATIQKILPNVIVQVQHVAAPRGAELIIRY